MEHLDDLKGNNNSFGKNSNIRKSNRGSVVNISYRLGIERQTSPEWLKIKESPTSLPERLAFNPPPKGKDGKCLYDPVAKKLELDRKKNPESFTTSISFVSPSMLPKRIYEPQNGSSNKRFRSFNDYLNTSMPLRMTSAVNHTNRRNKMVAIGKNSRKQMVSWVDAPDDVYFLATDATKKLRKVMKWRDLHRIARQPWKTFSDIIYSSSSYFI